MGPPWRVSGQGSRGGRGGHALTRHRPHQGGGLVDGDCIEDAFTVAEHRTFHDVGGRSCERSRQGGRIVHRCKVVGLGGGGWGSGLCRPPQCVCPPCDATAAWQCVQSSCGSVAVGRCALSRVRTGRRVSIRIATVTAGMPSSDREMPHSEIRATATFSADGGGRGVTRGAQSHIRV